MSRRLMAVALFAIGFSCPAYSLELNDALKDVLQTNPRVLEKLKGYNAAVKDMNRSETGMNPTLSVEAEVGREWVSNSSTRFTNKDSWVRGSRVVGRKLLYDGQRTNNDSKAREAVARSELYGYLDMANQVAYDTIESYLNVQKYLELVKLAQENIDIHIRLLEAVKTRVQSGKEGKSESERVMGRLAAAQSALIGRQNDYKRAVFVLHKNLGRLLDGDDLSRPQFNNALLPVSLAGAFQKQINNHPTLQSADYNIQEKEFEYAREKSEYRPTVALEASKDWRQDFNGIQGNERDTRLMVKFQHNLIDGGSRKHRSDRMVSLVNREKMIRDRVKRSIINDLQLTWSAYKLLDTQIGALRKSLFFTKKALSSYKEEFKIGKRLLINILDAENEYQSARVQLASLQFDLINQKYRVLYSMGTLVEDLGLKVPLGEELTKSKHPTIASKDRLPLNQDLDSDNVKDVVDISPNSLASGAVDAIGESTEKSQRYFNEVASEKGVASASEVKMKEDLKVAPIKPNVTTVLNMVSFLKNSLELTDESKRMMRELIEQLKPFAGEAMIRITVATKEKNTPELNQELALQRAYALKRILMMHDLDGDSIQVFGEEGKAGNPESFITVLVQDDFNAVCEVGKLLSRKDLVFPSEKTVLEDEAQTEVDILAQEIRRLGKKRMDVVVSSNDFGEPERDEAISLKRAEFLRDALKQKFGQDFLIVPVGWGSYTPGIEALGMTEENQVKNMVEIVLRD